MIGPTLAECFALTLLEAQRLAGSKSVFVHDNKHDLTYSVGESNDAERLCRYHYVEVRADLCRNIERAYNFPSGTEWLVRPWKPIRQVVADARRASELIAA